MYESFYKLHPTPFRLTPDPHFFFESKTHQRGMAYLRFAFYQREGFVVITGAPGTGKTALMLNLIEEIPQQKVSLAKIVSSNLDADALLDMIASSFGINPANLSKGALLKTLENYFIGQWRMGKQALLIIDEAHNLSIKSLIELSMLSNFQIDEQPVLQCFLLGQQPLEQKLNQPKLAPLKQRVIASTRLTQLNQEETRSYIRHRLSRSGWNNTPAIDEAAFSLIHRYTTGIPRKINSLCNRVLLQGFLDNLHEIGSSTVRQVIEEIQEEAITQAADMDVDALQTDAHTLYDPDRDEKQTTQGHEHTFQKEQGPHEHHKVNHLDNVIDIPVPGQRRDNVALTQEIKTLPTTLETQANHPSSTRDSHQTGSMTFDLHTVESRINNHARSLKKQLGIYGSTRDNIPGDTDKRRAKDELSVSLQGKSPAHDFHGTHFENDTSTTLVTGQNVLNETAAESVYDIYGIRRCDDEKLDPLNDIKKSPTSFKQKISTMAGFALILGIPALVLHGWSNTGASFNNSTVAKKSHPSYFETVNIIGSAHGKAAFTIPIESSHLSANGDRHSSLTIIRPLDNNDTNSLATTAPAATDTAATSSNRELHAVEFAASEAVTSVNPELKGRTTTNQLDKTATRTERPGLNPDVATRIDNNSIDSTSMDTVDVPQPKESPISNGAGQAKMIKQENSDAKYSNTGSPTTTNHSDVTTRQSPHINSTNRSSQQSLPLIGSPVVPATEQLASIAMPETMNKTPATAGNETDPDRSEPAVKIPYNGLSALLARFADAYEDGSLQEMVNIFSRNIDNSNGVDRYAMEQDYQRLFTITDHRQLTINNMAWKTKEDQLFGEGNFYAQIREKGATKATQYRGTISLVVTRESDALRIKTLDYDYR